MNGKVDDLISREDTIREIIKRSATDFMDVEAIATVIHIVNQMPSVEVPRWIPCSERLPDKYGHYLTTHACSLAYEVRTNVWVNRDPSYWLFGEGPVIAWMEMPKPYKAERKTR